MRTGRPPTHGMTRTRPYKIWRNMKDRCLKKEDKDYERYGARGITVCDRWVHSFENFWEDMGGSYSNDLTLDRVDNSSGYSPENCRWATQKEQANNRRGNHWVSFNGQKRTVAQWAESLGIAHPTLRRRLRDWTIERALTSPKLI